MGSTRTHASNWKASGRYVTGNLFFSTYIPCWLWKGSRLKLFRAVQNLREPLRTVRSSAWVSFLLDSEVMNIQLNWDTFIMPLVSWTTSLTISFYVILIIPLSNTLTHSLSLSLFFSLSISLLHARTRSCTHTPSGLNSSDYHKSICSSRIWDPRQNCIGIRWPPRVQSSAFHFPQKFVLQMKLNPPSTLRIILNFDFCGITAFLFCCELLCFSVIHLFPTVIPLISRSVSLGCRRWNWLVYQFL